MTVERLAVATGQSRIDANGEVENFSSPSVHAVYDIQLSGGDVARVLKDASLPEGKVHLTGSLTHQGRDNTAFLQSSVLAGEVSSAALQLKTQAGHVEVRNLSAAYKLAGGNIEIQSIRAQTFGGTINASFMIRDFAGAPHSRLQAHLRDISLERIEAAAPQYPLPEAHLRGTINADTDATWGRTLADLTAHADATLQGALGQNPSAPLSGAIHADYALIKADRADRWGNLVYRKTARNFAPIMASAARCTVVQVREIVELGALDPETIVTPGIFVKRVVRIGSSLRKAARGSSCAPMLKQALRQSD